MKHLIKTTIFSFSILFCVAALADNIINTNSTTVTNASGDVLPNSDATVKTTTTHSTTTVINLDDKIVTAVYAKYANDSALIGTNLSIKSVNGFVTIYGTVVAQSQADEAVIAAKSVPGVKDARSEITVTTNPATTNNKTVIKPNY